MLLAHKHPLRDAHRPFNSRLIIDDEIDLRPKRPLDESFMSELELDLEMDDLLEMKEQPRATLHILADEQPGEDLLADADDDCCGECRTGNIDDNAMDSTFISNLPEPEQSYEVAPIDYSVDMFIDGDSVRHTRGVLDFSHLSYNRVLPRAITSR